MDYGLAKKLKDAGFAHDIDVPGTQTGHKSTTTWLYGPKGVLSDETVYVPTLSELIEACGDAPFHLIKDINLNRFWIAYVGKTVCKGLTPEEAVASLWLALKNKKK